MAIKTAAYILCHDDDADVLPNALNSIRGMVDHVLLVYTGQRITEYFPVKGAHGTDRLTCVDPDKAGRVKRIFRSLALPDAQLVEYPWAGDWSAARNWALNELRAYDWVLHLDADELVTHQLYYNFRGMLDVPGDVSNIVLRMLHLWPHDETGQIREFSGFMAHGRIMRPQQVKWTGRIHEHLIYSGKRVESPHYLVHCRSLFEQRMVRQRKQSVLEAWPDSSRLDVPPGVTWNFLNYPLEDECSPTN